MNLPVIDIRVMVADFSDSKWVMRPARLGEFDGCPVCDLRGGFHDYGRHHERVVPHELIKEAGWHKKKDDE